MNVPRKLDTKQVEDNEKYHVHLDGYNDKYDVHLDGYDGINVPGYRAPSPPPHPQGDGGSSWGFRGGGGWGQDGTRCGTTRGKGAQVGPISPCGEKFGPSWAQLVPSWAKLGPTWHQVGTT